MTSTVSAINVSQRKRDDYFGARMTGYIEVPADGTYTFYTTSDDGSKLYIGSTEVVNNDGIHRAQERSGTIGLKAGKHALTVVFFENSNGHELSVSYSGPGVGKQVIPASVLYRVGTNTPPSPPTANLRDPENPANAVSGLDYSYYEGTWTSLPDFNRLTSVKMGTVNNIDLSMRNRDDSYGVRFTGYIDVPTDGQYTFYTSSDDGSKLYIGGTEVVNNDGNHPVQERSGVIGLKAGRHAITVVFFEYINGHALSVSYSGPGVGKQVIPASAFYRVVTSTQPNVVSTDLRDPENPANAVAGLDYRYYEGNWTTLPNFSALTPVKTGTAGILDISMSNRADFFGLRFTGYINVPNDGTYTFHVSSDDGSKLYIGDTEVVSHDGTHAQTEKSGSIGLKAGKHAFTFVYFENAGGEGLSVSYTGPNVSRQVIAASAFYRVSSATPPPTTSLRDPENPANAVAGLNYSYYEGGWWGQLPNFSAMTPVKVGTTGNVDVAVRNRNDRFGIRFTGYVNVPTNGSYTFYLNSDDGSKLYIGDTEVVNNDGGHTVQERSGTIGLKAGRHALTVLYFEDMGGEELELRYSGPNLNKQAVPAGAFFRVDEPTNTISNGNGNTNTPEEGTGTGLRVEYVNNKTLTAPIVLTRIEATIDYGWGDSSPAPGQIGTDNFSARWTGQVEAPVDGNYTFTTLSDDGVQLWVNNQLIISNWNKHSLATNHGNITLKGGEKYDIRLEYYDDGGGAEIRLKWAYPGQSQQTVPQSRLYPATGSGRVGAAATAQEQTNAGAALDVDASVLVYPVPAREVVRVRYTALVAGTVTLQLINPATQSVLAVEEPVVSGANEFKLDVGPFNRGLYILTLTQGGRRISRKVVLGN